MSLSETDISWFNYAKAEISINYIDLKYKYL